MKQVESVQGNCKAVAVVVAAVGALLVSTMTGCTGIELGGRLGVYRVDERQESQKTYRQPTPLKCYFTSCAPATEEVEGS